MVEQRKLTKAELEAVYRSWQREEAEAIDVILAVGRYLGPPRGRAVLNQEDSNAGC